MACFLLTLIAGFIFLLPLMIIEDKLFQRDIPVITIIGACIFHTYQIGGFDHGIAGIIGGLFSGLLLSPFTIGGAILDWMNLDI